ncbi:hypothetical protein FHS43_005452 [Streptosporangium becharense]|uniref:Uncharacterized protein n=1 Tax=Streptosporangium becharense TaxID=1816182 RepID=A0A7W9MDR7_9ACTN|nr:hypothetical protein [Streptosporangium becharense]MBB2914140.1 hypothetical protein [Streptosporangium becharense]MBB5817167.1 hypothetical protein [Streptosporangium becharense]
MVNSGDMAAAEEPLTATTAEHLDMSMLGADALIAMIKADLAGDQPHR